MSEKTLKSKRKSMNGEIFHVLNKSLDSKYLGKTSCFQMGKGNSTQKREKSFFKQITIANGIRNAKNTE